MQCKGNTKLYRTHVEAIQGLEWIGNFQLLVPTLFSNTIDIHWCLLLLLFLLLTVYPILFPSPVASGYPPPPFGQHIIVFTSPSPPPEQKYDMMLCGNWTLSNH